MRQAPSEWNSTLPDAAGASFWLYSCHSAWAGCAGSMMAARSSRSRCTCASHRTGTASMKPSRSYAATCAAVSAYLATDAEVMGQTLRRRWRRGRAPQCIRTHVHGCPQLRSAGAVLPPSIHALAAERQEVGHRPMRVG